MNTHQAPPAPDVGWLTISVASAARWLLKGTRTMPTEAEAIVSTEDWLIAVYVAVDTWWRRAGRRLVPRRPGPAPACSDQELVALAVAREVLERRSERAWRAEV